MKTKFYLCCLAAVMMMAGCEGEDEETKPKIISCNFVYNLDSVFRVDVPVGNLVAGPNTLHVEGFRFAGWVTESEYHVDSIPTFWDFSKDKVYDTNPERLGTHGSLMFYAVYECPVLLNYGGKLPNDTVWSYTQIRLSANFVPQLTSPVTEGFFFDGWYRDSRYTEPYADLDNLQKVTTLYAKWAPACTVTFNTQGGSSVAPMIVKGGSMLLRPEKPTHPDKTKLFFGWYKEAECINLWDSYGGVPRDLDMDLVEGNITLYARWYSIAAASSVHMTTCEGNSIQVLKDNLPGLYTWSKDGERSSTHYNPCPEGWTVPTLNEWGCIQNQLQILNQRYEYYWSRDIDACYENSYCYAKIFCYEDTEGEGFSGAAVGNKHKIRCIKYD
jgi:uncharacterized repeat protein (TIGR02543 family)